MASFSLWKAIGNDDVEAVRKLSTTREMISTTAEGYTPFHYCVLHDRRKSLEVLLALVENDYVRGSLQKAEYNYGYTVLHLAILLGSVDYLRLILEARHPETGLPIVPLHLADNTHRTPLHMAIQSSPAMTRALLEAGASGYATMADGRTPIHCALAFGREAEGRLVLERMVADPVGLNVRDVVGCTPAHTLFQNLEERSPEEEGGFRTFLYKTFFGTGASVKEKRCGLRFTPPEPVRLRAGDVDQLVRLMLQCESGSWMGFRNRAGDTPLDIAQRVMEEHPGRMQKATWDLLREAAAKGAGPSHGLGKVRVQCTSDLHIEFYGEADVDQEKVRALVATKEARSTYIALLGDIGVIRLPEYEAFLFDLANKFQGVFVILGNHEFYGSDVEAAVQEVEEICSKRENLLFCHRRSHVIDGVRFIGVTLWADIPEKCHAVVGHMVSDYKQITIKGEQLRPHHTTTYHHEDVQFIKHELAAAAAAGERAVVLSHHAPVGLGWYSCTRPAEWHSSVCEMNGTTMTDLFRPPLVAWLFGHTHWFADLTIGGVRIVSNPRGYPFEKEVGEAYSAEYALSF